MERDALAELSREQLIEPVVTLAAEVAELKRQQGQPPKTPGNSSFLLKYLWSPGPKAFSVRRQGL